MDRDKELEIELQAEIKANKDNQVIEITNSIQSQ